jgi:hypothetical protein
VSADREELRRLVEELPDERVPAVLAEARRQSPARPIGAWPPPGSPLSKPDRTDLARHHDDLLAEGFGNAS